MGESQDMTASGGVRVNDGDRALNDLDPFIAPHIRAAIEQQYYARINEQAQLQHALKDPIFLPHPTAHVALYADHGVVHVRDVAQQILQVLESIHGVLIRRVMSGGCLDEAL
jgi:hypothetical protein